MSDWLGVGILVFSLKIDRLQLCVCELGTDVWLTWLFSVKIDRLNCVCVSSGRAAYVLYWIGTGYVSEPSFFLEPEPSPKFLEPPKLTAYLYVKWMSNVKVHPGWEAGLWSYSRALKCEVRCSGYLKNSYSERPNGPLSGSKHGHNSKNNRFTH